MNTPGAFDSFDSAVYSPEFMKKTSPITSRLVKKEKKKMTQQTVMFVVLTVLVVVLFLFFILPTVTRLLGVFLDSGSLGEPEDTIPPRVPSISSPATATPSASLAVQGFAEPDSTVIAVVNGNEAEQVTADSEGAFGLEVSLNEGENTLSLYSVDKAGNESDLSREYSVTSDSTPPKLELSEPQDGQRFELYKNQMITIKGTTEERAKVYINDRLVVARADGSFTTTYQLHEGDNVLEFRVIDQAGNQATKTMTVHFRI